MLITTQRTHLFCISGLVSHVPPLELLSKSPEHLSGKDLAPYSLSLCGVDEASPLPLTPAPLAAAHAGVCVCILAQNIYIFHLLVSWIGSGIGT